MIRLRRKRLAGWLYIRPTETREEAEAQLWTPRTLGKLSKHNGTCSCWGCRGERYDRAKSRRESRGEVVAWAG